jgi:predicted enzyme related to lactoylglutathione lyase
MTTRLGRITISVAELSSALELYEGVLGLTREYTNDELAMLTTDDPAVEVLLHRREPSRGDFAVAPTFAVDDVDGTTAAAVVVGAEVVDEPSDQPWGERQAVLRDPDGHILCVVSPIPDESPEIL